jgi:hypothetical protein
MPFTVTEFRDLIHILYTQPEWRAELLRVLFPEALVDLPRALEELAEAQRRTEATLDRVTERMERGFAEAAADREVMKRDIGVLKGSSKERFYRDRAAAIFGRLLAAGQDATQEVAQRLRAAEQADRVSAQEYQSVLNADLLWSGKLWETGEEVVLVLEASWKVHESDVERAVQRAEVLRRAGLKALPVTAGEEWPQQVEALALRERVVIAQDGRVDDASWQAALASLHE